MSDGSRDEIIQEIERTLQKFPLALCYVKWTCPKCRDRVTSDRPNVFNIGGYLHTKREDGSFCGTQYDGDRYGFRLILPGTTADREKVLKLTSESLS